MTLEALPITTRVSIHVPLAEHDRGAGASHRNNFVSIHVPLAEHDVAIYAKELNNYVSIHVPLAEHDVTLSAGARKITSFQFTCPSRSTTRRGHNLMGSLRVSIHVPLAEHDTPRPIFRERLKSFNSRAPRGARLPHSSTIFFAL